MHARLLALAAVVTLIAVAATLVAYLPAGTASGAGNPHGDVDCDGDVDSVDALRILQQTAGIVPLPSPCKPPPVATATATATATPGLGSTRSNAVPAGMPYLLPEGWEFTVLDFNPDATDLILDESPLNQPPEPGMRFVLVRVRITNVGAASPANHQGGYAPRLVGSLDLAYAQFYAACGTVPDGIRQQPIDVFTGGTVEGNACFQVGEDETGFVLYTDYPLSDVSNWRWFAVE